MPYAIRLKGGKYQVVNKETGKIYGTHPSEKDARKQLRAIYASTGGK